MQLIALDKNKTNYIWASQALVGDSLSLTENVLLEINNNQIDRITQVLKENVTVEKCNFLEGITLLPGLIDAHVHLALAGKDFKQTYSIWQQDAQILDIMRKHLSDYLKNGVIAVRDGGDNLALNLRLAKSIQEAVDSETFPKLVTTGKALRKDQAYGSFLGQGIRTLTEIQNFISQQAKLGVDQLKVLLSGIVSFKEFGKVGSIQFTLEELQLIVDCAHIEGLKVMVHASSAQAVALAIEAGVDSIEHGYFLDEKSLYLMAEKNIFWLPTVIPVAIQCMDQALKATWTSQELEVITKVYESQLTKLQLAEAIGVPLGVGTDAGATGVFHGTSLFLELLKYSQAGLSNKTILQAVTKNNAKILGLENSLGTIDIKKEPRLIGVPGDPLKDLQTLKEISFVLL